MSVQTQEEKARTMGAIAAVVSAFIVFVLTGGAVLASWVSAQEAAAEASQKRSTAAVEAPSTDLVDALAEPEPSAPPIERPRPRARPSKRTKRAVARPQPQAEPSVPVAVPTEPVAPVVVAPSPPVNPNGKGTVMIIGDAERVRLIGNRGPFAAGVVPSGTYTIQATFEGDDPRMAGTVVIRDDELVRILCISEQRQCVRR